MNGNQFLNAKCATSIAPPRENCGNQLMKLAEEVAQLARETNQHTMARLCPIAREEPDCEKEKVGQGIPTWPGYLSDLRSHLLSIQALLNSINDTINRVEI